MSVTAPSPVPSPGRRAAPPELSVTSLTVRFGALTALSDVSLTVRAGECVAIAGENGAGKTTLIRAVGGDIAPDAGTIELDGRPMTPDPSAAARLGVRIVWQDLALADNLDTGANIMLGNERHGHLLSPVHLHTDAARILDRLGIPIHDTTRPVKSLSSGQRQMVAVARAMARAPRILLLDEPTSSLGIKESALVETLITRLRQQGTTILLACHDIGQMFRLADRIAVLRHGRLVTEVSPSEVHPDDVAALISGQEVDSSARRQLTRLHRLAGRLVTSDPSSSLSVILSAFGAAIGSERLCIHLLTLGSLSPEGGGAAPELHCAASLGVPETLLRAWERLPADADGGPAGLAAASQQPVIEDNIPARPGSWSAFGGLARSAKVASSWSVPVLGPGGLLGVITVFRSTTGKPRRDDLDLASLYAGQAANAVERDRLLEEVTARNQILETMREMLQTLAGPVPAADGLNSALQSLRGGLRADETALVTADPADPADPDGNLTCRAYSGLSEETPAATLALARAAIDHAVIDHAATDRTATDRTRTDRTRTDGTAAASDGGKCLTVTFAAPGGQTALLARWDTDVPADDATDLMEDAARSLRLALEREEALAAQQETMALRRSRDMQHAFLRRLSHELRTPLTAITGYATSLLQPDVTWDAGTRHRFLTRIAAESARLGRLVNDLLDFSAIESGVFRLACDWCDLPLVIDAAVAVLPPDTAPMVEVRPGPGLPAIWADHDRLEQVFVNLIGNALVHNPPGTRVQVTVEAPGPRKHGRRNRDRGRQRDGERATDTGPDTGPVVVTVADNGTGIPPGTLGESPGPGRSRGLRPGAGLGLSIAQGIIEAHGGSMELVPAPKGTRFRISLPVEETEAM